MRSLQCVTGRRSICGRPSYAHTTDAPMYTTLIQVAELAALVKTTSANAAPANVAILDCRHELSRPEWSDHAYREGHIPAAIQAHLDRDLSAPITAQSGRHPLPDVTKFADTLGQ